MKVDIAKEKLFDSVFLLQPSTPILCTTKNEDGSDHVAPFGWINPVSHKPPRVALALLNRPKKQHSLKNIERTGEFLINVPGLEIASTLVECAQDCRPGENKYERAGFKKVPAAEIQPVGIEECKAYLECKLYSQIDTGDHTLLIADIVHARYDDEAYFANLLINLDKFKPVIHLKHYNFEDETVHIFMAPGDAHVLELPLYKNKDKNK